MNTPRHAHLGAALLALFVTFLWSTSWVLIKIGLERIPAITFAGMRYSLAFLCLVPFALRPACLGPLRRLSGGGWARLVALGVLFYAITQGTQFVALALLPSMTTSLILNFTTAAVALMGIPLLGERLTALQWGGVLVNVAGVLVYFFPMAIPTGQAVGLMVASAGVLANAGSSILGRHINREGHLPPLAVTAVSMGVGAALLMGTGMAAQPLPRLTLTHWAIIGWLAVVNTALAFTLWNATLRRLSATESSIINSTMLVQIAVLAWVFLGERIIWKEGIGMALAVLGALLVQMRRAEGGI
jgi:drug/metabolite transporter (DMT)-like permease